MGIRQAIKNIFYQACLEHKGTERHRQKLSNNENQQVSRTTFSEATNIDALNQSCEERLIANENQEDAETVLKSTLLVWLNTKQTSKFDNQSEHDKKKKKQSKKNKDNNNCSVGLEYFYVNF